MIERDKAHQDLIDVAKELLDIGTVDIRTNERLRAALDNLAAIGKKRSTKGLSCIGCGARSGKACSIGCMYSRGRR